MKGFVLNLAQHPQIVHQSVAGGNPLARYPNSVGLAENHVGDRDRAGDPGPHIDFEDILDDRDLAGNLDSAPLEEPVTRPAGGDLATRHDPTVRGVVDHARIVGKR